MRLPRCLWLLSLALAGCAELPLRAEPIELPADPGGGAPTRGLLVEWTRYRPLAEPWYVVRGAGVDSVVLDPERRLLDWWVRPGPLGGEWVRYRVEVRLGAEDVLDGLDARLHTLVVGPLRGRSAEQALLAEGSRAPVAFPEADGAATVEYPHRLPGAVEPAARLRATRHLDPDLRERASVQRHLGFDLVVQADGSILKVDRATPSAWETATGLPYPGAVIVRER